jgi:hypothetical protein
VNARKSTGLTGKTAKLAAAKTARVVATERKTMTAGQPVAAAHKAAAAARKAGVQGKAAAERNPEPSRPRRYDGSAAQARISSMLDEVKTKNDDLEQRANLLLGRLG